MQPHPYALLHKPAPPLCTIAQASPTLCTIAQASPTPVHYYTSQPHPYALLHKPAPPLHKPAPPLCTVAQASLTLLHKHPCRLLSWRVQKLLLGVNWDRSRLQGATEDRSNDCQVHGIVLRMNRPHFCSPHSEGFFRRIHGVGSSDTVWSV